MLKRVPSTCIFSAVKPSSRSVASRNSPSAASFPVMDSMSISWRASANVSCGVTAAGYLKHWFTLDAMAGEIRSLMLPGPAGRLEALLNVGESDATHSALICHPHPLYGGTMHNKVVYNAMK